jgi:preprotein translocase subunit SecA
MNWLLSIGDTDILRDATNASAVFWYRARRAALRVGLAVALTVFLLLLAVLLVLGPAGTGLAWLQREWLAVLFSLTTIGWGGFCGWLGFKFAPSRNDRIVLSLRRFVRDAVAPLEEQVRALSDDELRAKAAEFKDRLAAGASPDALRPEAYACVREASRRARNHRQFECQLIGGKVLEDSNVAEMRTGEGKTIVCYMANYMKVLQGLKVHMVTVNDYLVKRDADFCRPIFALLGVSVGHITADMATWGPEAEVRRAGYACDITYGTNSEFGFDYLRDNMKHSVRDQVQGPQDFVVVDEVDSILIDEARTPLIISGPAREDVSVYRAADDVARSLIQKQEQSNRETRGKLAQVEANPAQFGLDPSDPKYKEGLKKFPVDPYWLTSDEADAIGHLQYFVVEADRKSVHMTEHGAKAAQQMLGIGTFYDHKNMNWPHYLDNALRAHKVYQKDKEYVVQEDKIIIVDEFTGRLMHGRQWSDGLHQAVEAKERVTVKEETQTLATITLQNLFKLYKQLAGMTGTALTEADEFMKIYKLEVVAIPTNKPVRRIDANDKIYKNVANKFDALVEEIRAYAQDGYPSDPWSLQDMLRRARAALVEQQVHGNRRDAGLGTRDSGLGSDGSEPGSRVPDPESRTPSPDGGASEQIALIDQALAAFNDGKGDESALAEGYRKLMGEFVGGRPVLVGTTSVEASETLSDALTRRFGVEHEVLNARPEAVARESEIVAKAGQRHEEVRGKKKTVAGNVTIATNMAGRGTDIVLGPGVAALGGLHVIGTERHESRRIDNQLRGRCGRQGDPGSSRFFLSFDDDLLRLFMGEWVLRMLNMLGFEEGMAIEDKRVTKGIERAQKKVEERNFHIRKNLLEYDEVMDYQRKTFYVRRQQVVEGRGLSELIWEMIDATVADAIGRYYDAKYPADCASEWAGQHLGVMVDANKLDSGSSDDLRRTVRDLATYEVRQHIQRMFGEYVDPETPPEEWDVRGLASWTAQYGLSLTQNQIRQTDPADLQDQVIVAAEQKIAAADLSPLDQYVDPLFGKARLVRWAREKFDVDIPLDDLATANRDEAERAIREKMRAAYRQREIEYPCGAVIDYALQRGGQNVNEVCTRIANWVNRKFRLGWTYEHLIGKTPAQAFEELKVLNADYMENGRLDAEIDAALAAHAGDDLTKWARERFGAVMDGDPLDLEGDVRAQLQQCAYEMLRYELTRLEQYVLLSTFDQQWKDHMYSMDLLRHSIGLRGYAEQDPKIAYKREGTRMFNEMLENVRERVTDLIFKVRIAGAGGDAYSGDAARPLTPTDGAPGAMRTSHADATGAGFSSAAADQQAAMRQQGEGGQGQTIRRETPRVGRNDPCPCGSGKKYKQCHGRGK